MDLQRLNGSERKEHEITHILEVGGPRKPMFICNNIHVCTYYVELAFICIIVYDLVDI